MPARSTRPTREHSLVKPSVQIATAHRVPILGVASVTLVRLHLRMGLTMLGEVYSPFCGTRRLGCRYGTLHVQTSLQISPTKRLHLKIGVHQLAFGVLRRATFLPISTNTRLFSTLPSVAAGLGMHIAVLAALGRVLRWFRTRPTLLVS